MKKMKKLLSMLVAATMTLAMAAPSFAETTTTGGNGTIKIDNPQKVVGTDGEPTDEYVTYDVYQIFTAAYNTGTNGAVDDTYTYTISSDSAWYSVVNAYDGISLTPVTTSGNDTLYYVETNNNFSAAGFANVLKAAIDGKATAAVLNETNNFEATVALGYYFVSTNSGALCNLTTTNPNVTIHDKNEAPEIDKKIVNAAGTGVTELNVQVGDTVNYKITGNVPDMSGYSTYTYTVKDTMSPGLTFVEGSAEVTIGGVDGTVTATAVPARENGGWEVTFVIDIFGKGYDYNAPIELTYSAVINDGAVTTDPVTNTAKLIYSNDPADPTGTGDTPETPEVEVYTSKIVIDKYNGANNEKLAGAQFVLQDAEGRGAKFYKYTAATADAEAKVEWVDNEADATVFTTGNDGAADINGLKDGTYYLKETVAPVGFNRLDGFVAVTINGQKNAETGVRTLLYTASVENNAGSMLPSTGGIGTTIFYAAGIILMAGAVFFVVRRKRA